MRPPRRRARRAITQCQTVQRIGAAPSMAVPPGGAGEGAAQPSGFLTIMEIVLWRLPSAPAGSFGGFFAQKPSKSAQGISTAEGGPSAPSVVTSPSE